MEAAMLKQFLADERGATAIEYGLIASLIALAMMAGTREAGDAISRFFTETGSTLANVTVP
jgi:pilus assembly protein Flp/PilA